MHVGRRVWMMGDETATEKKRIKGGPDIDMQHPTSVKLLGGKIPGLSGSVTITSYSFPSSSMTRSASYPTRGSSSVERVLRFEAQAQDRPWPSDSSQIPNPIRI